MLAGEAGARIYAAEIGDSLFLSCASVGPDSRAVAAVSLPLKRRIGKLAYAVSFMSVLSRWRREPVKLAWEGGELTCEAFYVAKSRYYAGSWSFAPEARATEPLLHVVAIERVTRFAYARFAWALLRGHRPADLPGITAFTCTQLSATSEAPIPVQADGDIVAALPVEIRLRPAPLVLC
jgi:diacylglycerol kinase family enzyme